MVKEIQKLKFGSVYNYIELNHYTNDKDSIKLKLQGSEADFKQFELNDSGLIIIQHNTIDYSLFENVYDIKFEIEYNESILPLNSTQFNTLEGLLENIKDLKSMEYIEDIRRVANKFFNIELNEFVLFGNILFDRFGQSMKIKYENIREEYKFKRTITTKKYFSECVNGEFAYGSGTIPHYYNVCPHCGEKWDIYNLKDAISNGNNEVYHIECNKQHINKLSENQFNYIISRVFNKYTLKGIRNEYGSSSYRGCWFMIFTEYGRIKIGWRKKVIEITWMDDFKEFKFNAKKEDTTKMFNSGDRYIHAWNIEKAIEYLIASKNSIIEI